MSSDPHKRLAATINTTITTVAFIGVIGFMVALLIGRDAPVATQSSERSEILAVMPNGKQQNPVARAMDQVTGMLEAVNAGQFGESYELRVEFVPVYANSDKAKDNIEEGVDDTELVAAHQLGALVEPRTRYVVAPGTSTDTKLLLKESNKHESKPLASLFNDPAERTLILTSVTGDSVQATVEAFPGSLVAAPRNGEMAPRMIKLLCDAESSSHKAIDLYVEADETDRLYSVPLKQALEAAALAAKAPCKICVRHDMEWAKASNDCYRPTTGGLVVVPLKTIALIGNENWWRGGKRSRLADADRVILSDGLSSRYVLDEVQQALTEPNAIVYATHATVRSSLKFRFPCGGVRTRSASSAEEAAVRAETAWHSVARATLCAVMDRHMPEARSELMHRVADYDFSEVRKGSGAARD